jgi:hypothetical protein
VCRHWRHAVRQQAAVLPPTFPWIISLSAIIYRTIHDGQAHLLSRSSKLTACWDSSENWLLLTSPWPKNRNLLENPLSRAIIPLPDKLQPDVDVDGLTELSCIEKFIVCSSNLIFATTMGTAPHYGPLIACCQPGMSTWSTSSHAGGGSCYQDIAFHHGSIYAVTRGGDLFKHEVSMDDGDGEAVVSSAKQVIKGGDIGGSRFLVVSRGKLLMVNHEKCYGVSEGYVFKVFEADVETARWSPLASLGDQVLFLSRRCSKALPASSHDEYLCGDRIYFVDNALQGPKKCRSGLGLQAVGCTT